MQLNVRYSRTEDRLILSILGKDQTEILIWLTRRYTRLLLGVFEKLLETGSEAAVSLHSDEIRQFRHESEIAGMDFQSDYQGGNNLAHPYGETPLLVTKISYQFVQNGNVRLTLGQEVENGTDVNLVLDKKLKHALLEMLLNASGAAEWGIASKKISSGPAQAADNQKKSPVH